MTTFLIYGPTPLLTPQVTSSRYVNIQSLCEFTRVLQSQFAGGFSLSPFSLIVLFSSAHRQQSSMLGLDSRNLLSWFEGLSTI